jgi:hypothetical protein
MKRLLVLLSACCIASPAIAECYSNPDDKTETIVIDDLGKITWSHRGKRVEFETGSGGTGVGYRVAYDPQGKGFRYEFSGNDLIFGDVRYVKGCD